MEAFTPYMFVDVQLFLLVLFRFTGMMLFLPIFGSSVIPMQVKGMLYMVISACFFPVMKDQLQAPEVMHLFMLSLMLVKEFFIGIMMSVVANIVIAGVRFAGEQIGRQIGFGMAEVFDPSTDSRGNVLVSLKYFLAMLIFLSLDGHHIFIRSMVQSFELIPLGKAVFSMQVHEELLQMSSMIFVYGIKMAAPVWVMIIVSTVTLGIMAKTAPDMNVLLVGFPLKIIMGMMGISMSIPLFSYLLSYVFEGMGRNTLTLMRLMGGA